MIIIQVDYQSLNTNKIIKKKNNNKLIKNYNQQNNRQLSINYLINYPYAKLLIITQFF